MVRWDRPGFGMSDREAPDFSLGAELSLLDHLVARLGPDDVRILAADDAGPVMVQFAARRPARVSHLALFGTAAEGRALLSFLPPRALSALRRSDTQLIHGLVAAAATRGSGPELGRWLASALLGAADARTIAALMVEMRQLDVRTVLPLVRAPTLVLHRTGDAVVSPASGRAMAAGIAGAEFAALAGEAHLLYAGDVESALRRILPFLAGGAEGELAQGSARLSRREVEVVRMVLLGLTSAEIGVRLAIRRRTVEAHLEHIRSKLGVRSRSRIAA